MDSISTSSLSYQSHISRRRSSVISNASSHTNDLDSAPSSPVDSLYNHSALPFSASVIDYTYVCTGCGFGTNLLSSYMPHVSNPCDKPAKITWGKI
ncbi:hypothetical protein LPJ66_003237 [Kickxella alabastrina]|uniref:Uncharacterized protein n=1 Tax=Kickxella alabastrina TaxID=61397 RepID=A0ACC1IL83_9FUNG|nr:hypothetical protein LPJ66_003237 [Kickxella alabastrina]